MHQSISIMESNSPEKEQEAKEKQSRNIAFNSFASKEYTGNKTQESAGSSIKTKGQGNDIARRNELKSRVQRSF